MSDTNWNEEVHPGIERLENACDKAEAKVAALKREVEQKDMQLESYFAALRLSAKECDRLKAEVESFKTAFGDQMEANATLLRKGAEWRDCAKKMGAILHWAKSLHSFMTVEKAIAAFDRLNASADAGKEGA